MGGGYTNTKLHTTISGMAKWCNVVTVSNTVCNIALSVDTNLIKAIFKLMAAKNKPIILSKSYLKCPLSSFLGDSVVAE